MADISQIEVNGITYQICDAEARQENANLQQLVNQNYATKSELPSFNSGWLTTIQVSKIGRIVIMHSYSLTLQYGWNSVGTLDSTYWPYTRVEAPLIPVDGSGICGILDIHTDGVVQAYSNINANNKGYGLSVCYLSQF